MIEPIYVHDPEYFQTDEWSPEELRDAAQSMSPATIDQVQRAWTALGTEGATAITSFSEAITGEIGQSWQGTAATNASGTVVTYKTTADGVQTKLDEVAGSFQPIYDAASRLKGGAVPEVQPQSLWDDITPWKTDTDDEHYRRHAEAVAAMNDIYRPGVVNTDSSVPVIPPLSEAVEAPNPVTPSGPSTGGPAVGPAGPTSDIPGSPTGTPTDGTPSTGNPGDVTAGAPMVDSTGVPDPSTSIGDESPAATGAASAVPSNPPLAGTPAAAGVSSGDSSRLGGGAGGHGGGSHGGTGGVGTGGGGTGGGFVGGAPAAGPKGLGSSTSPGGVGTAGRPGANAAVGARGGMGGMMGGAGRGTGGDDDQEHKTPGYLVTLENGNELIGTMPAVAPPVIGA